MAVLNEEVFDKAAVIGPLYKKVRFRSSTRPSDA